MGAFVAIIHRHAVLLEERGLDIELLERMCVDSSDRLGPDTIMIPYFRGDEIVGRKYRTIAGAKKFSQDTGSKQIAYNWNCLADPTLKNEPIIITEGEVDCWSALQAGYARVISVPAGAPATEVAERASTKYDFVADIPEDEKTIIILAVDSDGPGDALRNDLGVRLGRQRCQWLKYPVGCKDLNDALRKYGTRGVIETIARAQWLIGNVYRMSDIPAVPEMIPHASGFPGLDERYKLRLGDLAVFTGMPSAGKSTVIGDICCRMVSRYQWPVCFASFELEPSRDHRRILRTWFGRAPVADLDTESIASADKWIDQWFRFIVPHLEEPASLAWVMERMHVAATREGCRLFVIDPWNEIEHERPDGVSMTEYIGEALREFRGFARKYQVHLILAAHPAKMRRERDGHYPVPTLYDISDSAHFYNRCDVGVIVHRKAGDETLIRVAKTRFHDQIGKPGDIAVKYLWRQASFELFEKQTAISYAQAGE